MVDIKDRRGLALVVHKFFNKKSSGANTSCVDVTSARSETLDTQDKSAIEN